MGNIEITGLFPVPFMRVTEVLSTDIISTLIASFDEGATQQNSRSDLLLHSSVHSPEDSHQFRDIIETIRPRLVDFGSLIFGENLEWSVKEFWMNRLEPGGSQAIHSHANTFISGVIFLTRTHPSARTVFYKGLGGREFAFGNEHNGAQLGPFNAPKWVVPEPNPGDMILFPSYLLHEVPRNEGERRMTIAFNAVPDRLKSWDYELRFSDP